MELPKDAAGAPVHSIVLLPCPFCGGSDIQNVQGNFGLTRHMRCGDCGCYGPIVKPSEEEQAWNTRPSRKIDLPALAKKMGIKDHDPVIGLIGQ